LPGIDRQGGTHFGHDSQLQKVYWNSEWLALWLPTKGELSFELVLKEFKRYQKLAKIAESTRVNEPARQARTLRADSREKECESSHHFCMDSVVTC
jgi:hypothetical protein